LVDKIISKAHLILFLILFFSFIRTAFDLVNDQSLFNYISIFLSFVAVISMTIVLVIIHKEKNSKEEITK
jgi:hypothetical protein